jgi:hypothetical protein
MSEILLKKTIKFLNKSYPVSFAVKVKVTKNIVFDEPVFELF